MALAAPSDEPLAGFPKTMLTPKRKLFRTHQAARGPWWFSANGTGRYDLKDGQGTCYLADSAPAAFREWLGRPVRHGVVDAAELVGRVISTLSVSRPMSLADTTSIRAANHGMTKEISTITPYDLPQMWAAAWAVRGMNGVRYAGRFSTSPTGRCYALFGPAGESWDAKDAAPQPLASVAAAAGIRIVSRPTRVTIVSPPAPGHADR